MKYIQWGYCQSRTWVHAATNDEPERRDGCYGWWKRTACGKWYEIDNADPVEEERAKEHLCKKCRDIAN